jgi:site-specific recombinase XerD
MIKYLDGLKNGLYGVQIVQSSANTKMNVIRGFWSYLIDKEYVTKNIVNKIVAKKYKIKDKKVNVPTDEEVNDFLNNLENIKSEYTSLMYLAVAKLFLGSGFRLEELVGIDVDDLHFENEKDRYIMIMGKGEYEYTEPTKVNINQSAYIAIDDYLKIRNANSDIRDMKPLFISNERKRLSYKTIQAMFSNYSNKTIHPHLLRHYVGTKIYENGDYDIKKVQKQLRHKDINTSIKYYVGNDEEELKNVLDSF